MRLNFNRLSLVVLGAVVVFWTAPVFSQSLEPLAPTAASFESWRERQTPVYLECYMFNITNADDILAGKNVSIRVQQLGPYVYRETETKTNISWHDNGTVEFYNLRHWYFEPDMSNGSLTDKIVSVNPVIVTLSRRVRGFSLLLKMAINMAMKVTERNLFLKADVSSWLFDGVSDSLLAVTKGLTNITDSDNAPNEKFAWFYGRNGSINYDESFLMNTGAADISKLGNLEKWKFSERTVYRDQCGEVKGSTGELSAPANGLQNITVFVPDICTYMVLPAVKDVVEDRVKGVQYAADEAVFDNGHTVPDMACYCDDMDSNDCLPSGALNVTSCWPDAPFFVSLPHFLHSNPHYPNKIEGLSPTEDMNFHVTLEKSTGKPLAVVKQLQMNLLVRHVSELSVNNQLPDPDVLVPMFWYKREVRNTPK